MLSLNPGLHAVKKLLGAPVHDLEAVALESWEIAPAMTRVLPPAKFLPGQIERITGTTFGTMPELVRHLKGNYEQREAATMGFRLQDVELADGVLYARGAIRYLRSRSSRALAYARPREALRGACYESWIGTRWFGSWLLADCLTYPLAAQFAQPFRTGAFGPGHQQDYESALGMSARHLARARFEELYVFQDMSNNDDKRRRAFDFRDRIIAGRAHEPNPGVFLLRGNGGDRRVLVDELSLAERLAAERGFRVLDPVKASLDEIVQACAGAKVVMGVEGSHLVHGLMLMPADATLFVIQPPDRTLSVLKASTDRQGQTFAFVVGSGSTENFRVDFDEVARTLDLLH